MQRRLCSMYVNGALEAHKAIKEERTHTNPPAWWRSFSWKSAYCAEEVHLGAVPDAVTRFYITLNPTQKDTLSHEDLWNHLGRNQIWNPSSTRRITVYRKLFHGVRN